MIIFSNLHTRIIPSFGNLHILGMRGVQTGRDWNANRDGDGMSGWTMPDRTDGPEAGATPIRKRRGAGVSTLIGPRCRTGWNRGVHVDRTEMSNGLEPGCPRRRSETRVRSLRIPSVDSGRPRTARVRVAVIGALRVRVAAVHALSGFSFRPSAERGFGPRPSAEPGFGFWPSTKRGCGFRPSEDPGFVLRPSGKLGCGFRPSGKRGFAPDPSGAVFSLQMDKGRTLDSPMVERRTRNPSDGWNPNPGWLDGRGTNPEGDADVFLDRPRRPGRAASCGPRSCRTPCALPLGTP